MRSEWNWRGRPVTSASQVPLYFGSMRYSWGTWLPVTSLLLKLLEVQAVKIPFETVFLVSMIVYFHLYLYLTVMVYLGLGHLCGVNCSKSTLTHEQNSQLEKLKRSSNSDGSDRGQLKPGEKKGRAHFRWLLPIMSLRSHLFPSNREKFHLSLGKSLFWQITTLNIVRVRNCP